MSDSPDSLASNLLWAIPRPDWELQIVKGGKDMEPEYPDVLGEAFSVGNRFEADNIQCSGGLDPGIVRPGEPSRLVLHLKNTLDVPVEVTTKLEVPTRSIIAKSHLEAEKKVSISLGEAEVGTLTIPILTSTDTPAFDYEIDFEIGARAARKGRRIRPKKHSRNIGALYSRMLWV